MSWLTANVVQDDVYELDSSGIKPRWPDGYTSELKRAGALAAEDLSALRGLQGRFSTAYLRTFYKSPQTHVLLIRREEHLAGILWVVPGCAMRRRYPFVPHDAFAIISCSTAVAHRGRGLYPCGIKEVAASGLAARYFIWAHDTNVASLRGIAKGGGVKVGRFIRKRWLRGLVASIDYRKCDE